MRVDTAGELALLRDPPPRRWVPSLFGIVPVGARRRRPGDIVRVALASLALVVTALDADELTTLERRVFDVLAALPSWLRSGAETAYQVGSVGTVAVLLLALLVTRRWRLVTTLGLAGLLVYLLAMGLGSLVDLDARRVAAGLTVGGTVPEYPVVVLALCTTVLLVAGPYLLRPARRIVFTLLGIAASGAIVAVVGLPDDVIASLALGWGVAALFHLAAGAPAATPSTAQVAEALEALGVAVGELELAAHQQWGTTRYLARAPDGGVASVEVIGRDAADARLLAKLWHLVWYRVSGPALSLTRHQQLEHEAYVLLLAGRAGVPVSDVVIAGIGGSRDTAVLVLRDPGGVPFTRWTPISSPTRCSTTPGTS